MKKYLPQIVLLWVIIGVLNAGFVNADGRGRNPELMQSPRWARGELAFALGWSVFFAPVAVVMTPFLTGFYYSGWTLTARTLPCVRDPEIWCKP